MFLKEVDDGIAGRNTGLITSLKKLSKFINNIQKKTYYVIGANQKTGKTAFSDFLFILGPYVMNKNLNVKYIYFSFEIDLIEKMAKFCAFFMDYKYGIYCDSNYILSRGEDKLSLEHRKLVQDIYNNELVDLFGEYDEEGNLIKEGKIIFFQDKLNPEGIRKYLLNYASNIGKFIYSKYNINENGKSIEKQKIAGFVEKDSKLFTFIIVDHVGLLKRERGFSKKENIDKFSEHMVFFRNVCKFSPIAISQFNRDLGKIDRLKFSGEDLQPSIEDFKDTGSLAEDASLVMALFNPTLLPHLRKHKQYDLKKIGKGYRSLHILASRNTPTGVSVSLLLEGKTGNFKELPNNDEMSKLEKVYEYVQKLK